MGGGGGGGGRKGGGGGGGKGSRLSGRILDRVQLLQRYAWHGITLHSLVPPEKKENKLSFNALGTMVDRAMRSKLIKNTKKIVPGKERSKQSKITKKTLVFLLTRKKNHSHTQPKRQQHHPIFPGRSLVCRTWDISNRSHVSASLHAFHAQQPYLSQQSPASINHVPDLPLLSPSFALLGW